MASYNAPMGEGSYGVLTVFFPSPVFKCTVGNYCSIASGCVVLLEANHRMDAISSYPFSVLYPHLSSEPGAVCKGDVIIENDVWLGYNTCILSGVRIGNGAVVGAHSVVTKDVAPYTIVAGNPARVIRKRFDDETIEALLRIKWWDWPRTAIMAEAPLLCTNKLKEFIEKHDPALQQQQTQDPRPSTV